MSDEARTRDTDPVPDPLIAAVAELAQSSKRKTEAIGALARESGDNSAKLDEIASLLRTMGADMTLMRKAQQGILQRLNPLELEVDDIREEMREAANGNGHASNGNGHA